MEQHQGELDTRRWRARVLVASIAVVAGCPESGAVDAGQARDAAETPAVDASVPVADAGGSSVDAGDAGTRGDGGACADDNACPLAARCVFGECRPHPGGTGTPCPQGDECAVDALCTAGEFPHLGPLCVRACSASACPGGFVCQWWERPRDGGTVVVPTCLPADAFGTPCQNGDQAVQCVMEGEYCGGRSHATFPAVGAGLCIPGDHCSFSGQSGCAVNQTCLPAGLSGQDNTRATVCQAAPPEGGGQNGSCPCRAGFHCISLSSRHSVCLKLCSPGSTTHGCTGVEPLSADVACATGSHSPLLCPDGGASLDAGTGEAHCISLAADAPPGSIAAGVCR